MEPTTPSARVVADSMSEETGDRVTSFELVIHRFILAELNTACSSARNSSSSRAIPVTKQLARYRDDPAWPISLPAEKPGMSGGRELVGADRADALGTIACIHSFTAKKVSDYLDAHPEREHRLHKSVLNRYLEPLGWHKVLYTASAWGNFLAQRAHPDAQPEFRVVAEMVGDLLASSRPARLHRGQWHLPYLPAGEAESLAAGGWDPRQISAARCARTSYMTQDGRRDPSEDVDLCARLVRDLHMSPLEHVCTPDPANVVEVEIRDPSDGDAVIGRRRVPLLGKWAGWQQYRHLVEARAGWNSHA